MLYHYITKRIKKYGIFFSIIKTYAFVFEWLAMPESSISPAVKAITTN